MHYATNMHASKRPSSRQFYLRHDSRLSFAHLQTSFARTSRKPNPAHYERKRHILMTSTTTEKFARTAAPLYLWQPTLDCQLPDASSSPRTLHSTQFRETTERLSPATAATKPLRIHTPSSTITFKSKLAVNEAA